MSCVKSCHNHVWEWDVLVFVRLALVAWAKLAAARIMNKRTSVLTLSIENNQSSGNWGKRYEKEEQRVIRGSGNLPLPVLLIINLFLLFANLVWNLQPQAFKLMDSVTLLLNQRYWTCFPSQPSFPFYPRVEWFSGSLALLLGFLRILLPLWPAYIPFCCPCMHLEHEFVGQKRWFLSPHNYLLLSALERTWKHLSFNSPGISLTLTSEGLWRFTFMVCIHTKDPQWSSFLPFGPK